MCTRLTPLHCMYTRELRPEILHACGSPPPYHAPDLCRYAWLYTHRRTQPQEVLAPHRSMEPLIGACQWSP